MANNFEMILSPAVFLADADAQLVAGDLPCGLVNFKGRPALAFDDTDEEAAVTPEFQLPASYTGTGTLKVDVLIATASDATNDVAIDVFVEAKTPGSDTLDMAAATSWGTANSGTKSFAGTTAGDPVMLTITLSNTDSLAPLDWMRFGVRRDTDSANDDAVGDVYILGITFREEA